MRCDTVVYLMRDNKILMLLRNKKENDINEGKYIGVGGKIEENESPYEGAIREVREETGYVVKKLNYRGHLTFISNETPMQYIYVFTCSSFEGEQIECNEGTLSWVDKKDVLNLNIWEGDREFLEKIINDDENIFMIKNEYHNDKLIKRNIEI